MPTKKRRTSKKGRTAAVVTVVRAAGGDERVLALDVSSKCVGWSVFDNGRRVAHGRYVQLGDHHGERLMNFRRWVLKTLAEVDPQELIYEEPYRGRNGNTFGILARYAGIVELAHFEYFGRELPVENAVPAKWVKRAIQAKKGKNHDENKRIVLKLVNQYFGLALKYKENDTTKKVSQDDEADAIALNWAWHVLYRGGLAA